MQLSQTEQATAQLAAQRMETQLKGEVTRLQAQLKQLNQINR